MNTLKNKLSDKVNNIQPDVVIDNFYDTNTNSLNDNSNLILFKPNVDNKMLSTLPDFEITLNQARERLQMLQSFVKEFMIPGVDYGIIPKTTKPTLLKPGGEKLCDIFGFSKQIEVINRVENFEQGIFYYEVKVILTNKRTGLIEAEGIGSCNNKERKYVNQDSYSILNTILKMAKKRGFIDAVLSATRSSGIFSQDMEDQVDDKPKGTEVKKAITTSSKIAAVNVKPINQTQLNEIVAIVNLKKIPSSKMKSIIKERYTISESKLLDELQGDDLINFMKTM